MSLKSCLKKIGLEAHEKAIINGAVQEYRGDGYAAHEAAVEAVKDYIDQLQTEKADIERQIKVASPEGAFVDIQSTDDIVEKYKGQGVDVYLTDTPATITLHTLIVPKEERRRGIGSQAMRDVTELADKLEKRVLLTPAQKDDFHGTTSKERLVKFYKHFGFVQNKGRNKDFTISETMYRDPKKKKAPVEGRPYANVPDNLMGFGKQPGKGYWDTQYPVSLAVTVDYGTGPWEDAIRGMNYEHALERARRNWPGAKITPGELTRSAGPQLSLRDIRTRPIPVETGAIIQSHWKASKYIDTADHKAAKEGDREAAVRIIQEFLDPKTILEAAKRFGKDAIYVGVHAIEATGNNALPGALARFYADRAGGSVGLGIVQTKRAFHTGTGAMERLVSRPKFGGKVEAGGRYVLVDDAVTLGGTVAELANHILENGGDVVGIIALTNASRNSTLIAPKSLISTLEKRYGNEIRSEFNVDPQSLTIAEAKYLNRFRDAESLRDRAAKARAERQRRLLQEGILPDSPEEVGPALSLRTDTPEFRNWFADSKMVDANGQPMVMYHGTASEFDFFDKKKIGSIFNNDKEGFFFTNNVGIRDLSSADSYAMHAAWSTGGNPSIIPVFLSLQNPLIFDDRDAFDGRSAVGYLEEVLGKEDVISQAHAEGRDGILIIDRRMDVGSYKYGEPASGSWNAIPVPEYIAIAFEPTQIKSAIGNRGTFDPTKKDITLSLRNPDSKTGIPEFIGTGDAIAFGKTASIDQIDEMRRLAMDYAEKAREYAAAGGMENLEKSINEGYRSGFLDEAVLSAEGHSEEMLSRVFYMPESMINEFDTTLEAPKASLKKGKGAQQALFTEVPAADPEGVKLERRFKIRMQTTGYIAGEGYVITGMTDAASLLASIRKASQENLYTLAVAPDGTVLEIHRGGKGTASSVGLSLTEIIGRAMNVPGVSDIYFVHNHPAANVNPSTHDIDIVNRMTALASTAGLNLQALIISGGKYSDISANSMNYQVPVNIRPTVRKINIPIKERYTVVVEKERIKLKFPEDLPAWLQKAHPDQDGIVLIDNQMVVTGWLNSISHLTPTKALAEILKALEATGANAMVFYSNGPMSTELKRVIGTIAAATGEIRVMDVWENGKSLYMAGTLESVIKPFTVADQIPAILLLRDEKKILRDMGAKFSLRETDVRRARERGLFNGSDVAIAEDLKNLEQVDKGLGLGAGRGGRPQQHAMNINKVLDASPYLVKQIRNIEKTSMVQLLDQDNHILMDEMEKRTEIQTAAETRHNKPGDLVPRFKGFYRSFAQTYLDGLDDLRRESFRKAIVKSIEQAFMDPTISEYGELDIAIRNIGVKKSYAVARPLRKAKKTTAVLNINTQCPMMTIGLHGCYLDGCYVTGLAHNGQVVNYYRSAIYTGEILQLTGADIKRLNDAGGLRVNGQGDTSINDIAQWRDVFRHAEMRGLKLKVITKQDDTMAVIEQLRKEGFKTAAETVIQVSMDPYWVEVKTADDVAGSAARTKGVIDAIDKGDLKGAVKIIENEFGRDAKIINGKVYRKYGYSWEKVKKIGKKYPELRFLPRVVVATPMEISEYALKMPEVLQTWMHAAVRPGMWSDIEGAPLADRALNFEFQIAIRKVKGEWRILRQKEKTSMEVTEATPYKAVEDYIKGNYTPAEQEKIFKTLAGQLRKEPSSLCCQISASRDACNTCQSICAMGSYHTGSDMVDMASRGMKEIARGIQAIGRTPDVKASLRDPAPAVGPVWYSRMENHLNEKLPNRIAAADLMPLLQSFVKGGYISPDEIEWSFIGDWVNDQDGKVSKQQIMDYLAEENLRVTEVLRGSKSEYSDMPLADLEKLQEKLEAEGRWDESMRVAQAIDGIDETTGATTGQAKYAPATHPNLNIPGGKKYRELLLTKYRKAATYRAEDLSIDTKTAEMRSKMDADLFWWVRAPDQLYQIQKSKAPTEQDAISYVMREKRPNVEGLEFRSGHWREPDVLVWIRFDERIDNEGKRVLFIQEIQSDWHQRGKNEGYIQPPGVKYYVENLFSGNRGIPHDTPEAAQAEQASMPPIYKTKIVMVQSKQTGTVPDAPFKNTWQMLAMKRMIRYASENGYDKLAWTTGKQQIDRYDEDLRKNVDSISWWSGVEGFRTVTVYQRSLEVLTGTLNSRGIFTDGIAERRDVDAVFGKNIGGQIMDKTSGQLMGEDLSIGGQIHKFIYDTLLPQEMNKAFGKESWGKARVGKTTIATGPFYFKSDQEISGVTTPKNWVDVESVHSIDITPQMREKSVKFGMPLLSLRDPRPSPFYSQMEEVITNRKVSGPPSEIIRALDGWARKGEIKLEELKWSGLREWLQGKKGKVNNHEILDYLDKNNVRIYEIIHTGPVSFREMLREKGYNITFDFDDEAFIDWFTWSDIDNTIAMGGIPADRGLSRMDAYALQKEYPDLISDEKVEGILWAQEEARRRTVPGEPRFGDDAWTNRNVAGAPGIWSESHSFEDAFDSLFTGAFAIHKAWLPSGSYEIRPRIINWKTMDPPGNVALNSAWTVGIREPDIVYELFHGEDANTDPTFLVKEFVTLDQAKTYMDEMVLPNIEEWMAPESKHAQYTQGAEGRTNQAPESYKEILLIIPQRGKPAGWTVQKSERVNAKGKRFTEVIDEKGRRVYAGDKIDAKNFAKRRENTYKSPHWEERNVLVHIRLTERMGPRGLELFVEEIQSDWNQSGLKTRYFSPDDTGSATLKDLHGISVEFWKVEPNRLSMPKAKVPGHEESEWIVDEDTNERKLLIDTYTGDPSTAEWKAAWSQADRVMIYATNDPSPGNVPRTMAKIEVGSRKLASEFMPEANGYGVSLYKTSHNMESIEVAPYKTGHIPNPPWKFLYRNLGDAIDGVMNFVFYFEKTTTVEPSKTEMGNFLGTDIFETSREVYQVNEKLKKGVPDVPFKSIWTLVALKRMVLYAAEHGYKKLNWATGKLQYNLWGSERFDYKYVNETERVGEKYPSTWNAEQSFMRGEFVAFGIMVKPGEDIPAGIKHVDQTRVGPYMAYQQVTELSEFGTEGPFLQDVKDGVGSWYRGYVNREGKIVPRKGWHIVFDEQFMGEVFINQQADLNTNAIRNNLFWQDPGDDKGLLDMMKFQIRQEVDRTIRRENYQYSAEKWEKRVDHVVDALWTRLMEKGTGRYLPRLEGMTGYYDEKVVNEANAFFNRKQWGNAKVTTSELFMVTDRTPGEIKYAEIEYDLKYGTRELPPLYVVNSIPITEEMESAAADKGFPAFSLRNIRPPGDTYLEAVDSVLSSETVTTDKDIEADPFAGLDPAIKDSMKASNGVPIPTKIQSAKKTGSELWYSMTRHRPYLDPAADGQITDILRTHQETPENAVRRAMQIMVNIVGGLKPKQYEVFSLSLIMDDMIKDIESGLLADKETLPFGFTQAQAYEYRDQLKALAESDPAVTDALRKRGVFMKRLRVALVDADLLPKSVLDDDRYFHHQVLEYKALEAMGEKYSGVGLSKKDVRLQKKGWQRGRVGSVAEYNTSYHESEFEVISQGLAQLETLHVMMQIKDRTDISDTLKAQAKHDNYVAVVGGQANYDRLLALRGQRSSILQQDTLDSDDRKMLKQISEEIRALDPTQPFRSKIAMGYARLAKALGIDVEDDMSGGEIGMKEIAQFANSKNQEESISALTILKAISERNQFIEKALGDQFVTVKSLIPDNYIEWKPTPGQTWYKAFTLTDRLVAAIMEGSETLGKENAEKIKTVLARGRDVTWVIPKDLAKTMDGYDIKYEDHFLSKLSRGAMGAWKQWILINPVRVLKYNINNMSGDLDVVFAYRPEIISKYFWKAMTDLGKELNNKDMDRALRSEIDLAYSLGVLSSGWAVQEVADVAGQLTLKKQIDAITGADPGVIEKTWDNLKKYTMYRENLLRFAAFRYFRAQLEAGKTVYGVSEKAEVDGMVDQNRKAAKMARELLGDYGNLTHAGQWVRNHMIPFYSWMEINAPRYIRLMKNIKYEGGGAGDYARATGAMGLKLGVKIGFTTAKMAAFFILAQLWNRLMWPDEEERLGEQQRRQMHLILGKRSDGTIITMRVQGAFSDALSWFGGESIVADAYKIAAGKKDVSKQAIDMLLATPRKLIGGIRPDVKGFAEIITGKSTYPNPFKAHNIRDRMEYVARTFSLDGVYNWVRGRPKRGDSVGKQMFNDLANLLTYTSDPGEMAYYDTTAAVAEYLERLGKERSGAPDPTDKANALFWYKQGLKYGDLKAAEKYLKAYYELGGTDQGLEMSIKRAHPLGMIAKKDQEAFLATMTPGERERLRMAEDWYNQTYKGEKAQAVRGVPTGASKSKAAPQKSGWTMEEVRKLMNP